MTSKEELYKIANQILDYSIERVGAHPTAQIREEEMQWLLRTNSFRQILKDLEVLEILKRIVKIVDCSKYPVTSLDSQLVILSGGEIKNVEDYDKIKEWLENDK